MTEPTPTPTLLTKFFTLVQDQFAYGGQKYKLQGETTRESTDVLFDTHGASWLFGTVHKYVYRYTNLQRERDLLKIATYQYITWLKRGFFCKSSGVFDSLDTNVEIKTMFFSKFQKAVEKELEHFKVLGEPVEVIGNFMASWSNGKWDEISETNIVTVFLLAYKAWEKDFGENGGNDRDTYNETK